MKWAPQIRLRTIFLFVFCAAVGLACGTSPPPAVDPTLMGFYEPPQLNWHYGLLSAASSAMVIGLAQQVGQLVRLRRRDGADLGGFGFAIRFGITWRIVVALTIFSCLLIRLFVSRHFFELPEHPDILLYADIPNQLWQFCVIIVLSNSIGRWRRGSTRVRPLPGQTAAAWLLGTLLALILLPDVATISFLVYLAISGIEAAQPGVFQRIGTYPDQQSEGFRLYWLSLVAVGVVVFSAITFTSIEREGSAGHRRARIGGFLALLTAAAGFAVWYYFIELGRISPEMAEAGFPAIWFDWLGAALLVAIAISVGAYRLARGEHALKVMECSARLRDEISLHETFLCQLCLIIAATVYLGTTVLEFFMYPPFGQITVGEVFCYTLQDPTSILCLAIGLLSFRLAGLCWRARSETFVWKLHDLDGHRFAWNWLGLAALALVGIPVIAAYCFAFWLGPWYLYGN